MTTNMYGIAPGHEYDATLDLIWPYAIEDEDTAQLAAIERGTVKLPVLIIVEVSHV